MDVHSGQDYPNPYGLGSADFDYDQDSYSIALRFLSDLTGGTEESRALEINGANTPMLRNWESSPKFRRVLAKCRAAIARDRLAAQARETESQAVSATGPGVQRFIALEEMPSQPRSVFSRSPGASWGGV